jgi:hypothetical protein
MGGSASLASVSSVDTDCCIAVVVVAAWWLLALELLVMHLAASTGVLVVLRMRVWWMWRMLLAQCVLVVSSVIAVCVDVGGWWHCTALCDLVSPLPLRVGYVMGWWVAVAAESTGCINVYQHGFLRAY